MPKQRCPGSLRDTPPSTKTTPCPECGLKQLPSRSGRVPIHAPQSLPRTPMEQCYSSYEACHRCDRPMTASLPCIDPVTDDEHDHHLDEPIGAGLPNNDAPTFAELNADERHAVLYDGWVR